MIQIWKTYLNNLTSYLVASSFTVSRQNRCLLEKIYSVSPKSSPICINFGSEKGKVLASSSIRFTCQITNMRGSPKGRQGPQYTNVATPHISIHKTVRPTATKFGRMTGHSCLLGQVNGRDMPSVRAFLFILLHNIEYILYQYMLFLVWVIDRQMG